MTFRSLTSRLAKAGLASLLLASSVSRADGLKDLLDGWAEQGIALRKGTTGDDAGKTATFGNNGQEGAGSATFALTYTRLDELGNWRDHPCCHFNFQAGTEGTLGGASSDKGSDYFRAFAGVVAWMRTGDDPGAWGLFTRIAPEFETNKEFTNKDVLARLDLEPSIPGIGFNQPVRLDSANDFFLTVYPVASIEWGSRIGGAATEFERSSTLFRLRPGLQGDLELPNLAKWLTVDSVSLTGGNSWYWLPTQKPSATLTDATAALTVSFGKNFSIGLNFENGAQPPNFKRSTGVGITFGVGFGSSLSNSY